MYYNTRPKSAPKGITIMCFHPETKKSKNENLTCSDIHVLKTTWANALSVKM